jgi:hypothetical protein
MDVTASTAVEGNIDGNFNGVTNVEVCAAPGASTRRIIREIVVYNADTASITFSIMLRVTATDYYIAKVTLGVNGTWAFDGTMPTYDIAANIHGSPNKTTPVNADEAGIWDSVSGVLNKVTWANIKATLGIGIPLNAPNGFLINGIIVPSVTSNNLTVAMKGMNGNDPSPTNPVYILINGVVRSITSALSVTKNAATNWCNAGGAELATKEIDYFVYLGYNATDGVTIGFSRIPYAALYSDFSATTTNEKYCAISTITNAAAGDNYANIGRFAATLSAGAGYTWSVPTFTAINLIQRPIFETRKLLILPTFVGFSAVPTVNAYYYINGMFCHYYVITTVPGTSNATNFTISTPMASLFQVNMTTGYAVDNGTPKTGACRASVLSSTISLSSDMGSGAFTNSGQKYGDVSLIFAIN